MYNDTTPISSMEFPGRCCLSLDMECVYPWPVHNNKFQDSLLTLVLKVWAFMWRLGVCEVLMKSQRNSWVEYYRHCRPTFTHWDKQLVIGCHVYSVIFCATQSHIHVCLALRPTFYTYTRNSLRLEMKKYITLNLLAGKYIRLVCTIKQWDVNGVNKYASPTGSTFVPESTKSRLPRYVVIYRTKEYTMCIVIADR